MFSWIGSCYCQKCLVPDPKEGPRRPPSGREHTTELIKALWCNTELAFGSGAHQLCVQVKLWSCLMNCNLNRWTIMRVYLHTSGDCIENLVLCGKICTRLSATTGYICNGLGSLFRAIPSEVSRVQYMCLAAIAWERTNLTLGSSLSLIFMMSSGCPSLYLFNGRFL